MVILDNFARGKKENLVGCLEDERCSIFPYGGDIRETDILDKAFEGVDYVFHLAAMWLLHCKDFPRTAVDVNISGTFNVLETCVKHKVKKLIYSPSASVYGDAVQLPMTEDHPFNNKNFYGASKSDLQRHKDKGGSLLPEFNLRGFNYRMTDFQGALGVCQLQKAERIMQGRRKIAKQYDEALRSITALVPPSVAKGYRHAYQSYVCLFGGRDKLQNLTIEKIDALNCQRNEFMQYLTDLNIATRQGTHAVHTLGFYRNKYHLNSNDYINAYAADRLSVTLPLYAGMTDEEF